MGNTKKIKAWAGFTYNGNIICRGNEPTYSEMELNAIEDLHPKLKVIEKSLLDIINLIPLYNNWLKVNHNKENIISTINILDNFLLKNFEYIHSQSLKELE